MYSTWTRIGGSVLASIAYDLFFDTLVRFPVERLGHNSPWSELNHQYGCIQASSSQQVPETDRCPGWPCRAAFCPRRRTGNLTTRLVVGLRIVSSSCLSIVCKVEMRV